MSSQERDPARPRKIVPPGRGMDDAVQSAVDVLGRASFREIQRLGHHFQPNNYYTPLVDCDFLEQNDDLRRPGASLPLLDWNHPGQLAVAEEVAAFVDELRDVPEDGGQNGAGFHWANDFWTNADAIVQYGLLRSRAPERVVEVGCGWSSLLMRRALEHNTAPTQVDLVEPDPNEQLFAQLPGSWVHHRCILQRAPLEIFERLEPGDVCFYDGSHCVTSGGDVTWFFFEILPRLAPGVLIHLHDIFLPDDYPDDWIFERGQSWNEQYLLQAFLMYNRDYEILIANRYLWQRESARLDALYGGVQPSYGCSFWMMKRD